MWDGTSAYPACTDPFNDVPNEHIFCGEVEWMSDSGIADGYPDGGFHPTAPVSRQAAVAFIYRTLNT